MARVAARLLMARALLLAAVAPQSPSRQVTLMKASAWVEGNSQRLFQMALSVLPVFSLSRSRRKAGMKLSRSREQRGPPVSARRLALRSLRCLPRRLLALDASRDPKASQLSITSCSWRFAAALPRVRESRRLVAHFEGPAANCKSKSSLDLTDLLPSTHQSCRPSFSAFLPAQRPLRLQWQEVSSYLANGTPVKLRSRTSP